MSLKGDKYETQEEINFRLAETIVLYDGKPVFITKVRHPEEEDKKEIARVYFYTLPLFPGQKEERRFLSSRKFDLTPFKMGYMNYKQKALFLSRLPVRQNRQGLSTQTLVCQNPDGSRAENLGVGGLANSREFIDMVEGRYPSFKEAGAMLGKNDCTSVAISRRFAFTLDHDLEALYLYHKDIKCGIAFKEDKGIKVPPKFLFLREEMEECRIPIA